MEEINLLARKSFGVPRPFWAEPMAIMLIQMEAGQNLWPKIMRRYPRPYNLNLSSEAFTNSLLSHSHFFATLIARGAIHSARLSFFWNYCFSG